MSGTDSNAGQPYSPALRSLRSRIGVLESWARTADRPARTAPARAASPGSLDYWQRKVDPDATLPDNERLLRAEAAKRAYFLRLAMRSAEVRAAKAAARKASS